MKKLREERSKILSFNQMLPNIISLGALCSGLTALRFALNDKFHWAVILVVFAAFLDNLDGRVARMVGVNDSGFGAELDSLCDLVNFGVAPALVLYLWTLKTVPSIGWLVVLIYCICGALRLARFNTQPSKTPQGPSAYFSGTPIPAGAGFVLFPIMLSYALNTEWTRTPWLVIPIMLISSALMVSRVPCYSFKRLRIPVKFVLPILIGIGAFVAFISSSPWFALIAIVVLYAGSIPFAMHSAKNTHKRKELDIIKE
ncbi:MAG: CDP-diacylglycerol--serine O-phosphatidyltransferase [Alphaproteobacteria bacterium]|jgi:CDP-diacylglycerol--serine O-phosphatidyltransferase|nr:CDP-diacylglycerol--serine O-phosphatidyltransferase [Alphaproteobacteria bacterium]MDP3533657.1 CDP-diacylglycerol--serine O-phosphatidyltransferase [Alphaproteobacteria bacterium]